MKIRRPIALAAAFTLTAGALVTATPAQADAPPPVAGPFGFSTGLSAGPAGTWFVADSEAGVQRVKAGTTSVLGAVPGVSDVLAIGAAEVLAVTGAPPEGTPPPGSQSLLRVSKGRIRVVASLGDYERANNTDGRVDGAGEPIVESNPFDIARLADGTNLVADAAGNALLAVTDGGDIDWVAIFPDVLASTAGIKMIAGCGTPDEIPDFAFVCGFPDEIPVEPVPDSVAVGPDGAYYVTSLGGFPSTTGASKVWRIEPGTRHADCATSPACSVVAEGLTAAIDVNFGPDGTAYVVELDEAGWLAAEFGMGAGGTLNACTAGGGGWTCDVVAGGLPFPTAVVHADGAPHVLMGSQTGFVVQRL